ncbi:MAG: DUF3754 domain-containing protein [Planctomycetota bacterium]
MTPLQAEPAADAIAANEGVAPPPAHDAAADTDTHEPDNRFIPVRLDDLIAAVRTDPARFGPLSRHIDRFADALARVIDQETRALHAELDARYAQINPERDTIRCPELHGRDLSADEAERSLLERLDYVMDKASYEKLDNVAIERAIAAANSDGLRVRVDPEDVVALNLWVRGRGRITRWRRPMLTPWKRVPRKLETYRRLAVAARLQGEDALRLRLFREIPVADVEALLPHARVSMSLWDKFLVLGSGAGAFGSLVPKLVPLLLGGAAVTALSSLGKAALLAFAAFGLRWFLGSRRTKKMRDGRRTQNLYERSMASNAAVLHTVVAQIGREEKKEALLSYAMLHATKESMHTEACIDREVERWLQDRFGVEINFDGADGFETLRRLDLVEPGEPIRQRTVGAGIERMEDHWARRLGDTYHAG